LENCWVWVSKDFMRLAPVPIFLGKKKISTDPLFQNCKYFFAEVSKCKFSDNSYQLIFKGGFYREVIKNFVILNIEFLIEKIHKIIKT
jgi:hypothetical protein